MESSHFVYCHALLLRNISGGRTVAPLRDEPVQNMLTQLNPPLPLQTSKGSGLAHFVIDYGPESHLMWVVFLDADGACWTVPNPEIRMAPNWSFNRRLQNAEAAKQANGHDSVVSHPVLRTR